MLPNYIVKKSSICALNFWLILASLPLLPLLLQIAYMIGTNNSSAWIYAIIFAVLLIPFFIQTWRIIVVKSYSAEFYDNKIVVKSGVINKREDQFIFIAVNSVSVRRTLAGRIFGYGDVMVDCRGSWDVDTYGIKRPLAFKRFLESRISSRGISTMMAG